MGRTYTFDHVDAAMCMIEEIAAPSLAGEPWRPYRDQWGIQGLRDVVLEKLAWPCHEAWLRALERHDTATDDWSERRKEAGVAHNISLSEANAWDKANPPPPDPGAFDYEFVPFWLRTCVDWSGDHPRVKGRCDD